MARKRPARTGNPDLRQQKQVPMPPIEEIEQKIYSLLSLLNFKPLKLYEKGEKRVEDAFLLTKRLLGLAYIWVGDNNGVQIQIFATWIFYAVLNQLYIDVA